MRCFAQKRHGCVATYKARKVLLLHTQHPHGCDHICLIVPTTTCVYSARFPQSRKKRTRPGRPQHPRRGAGPDSVGGPRGDGDAESDVAYSPPRPGGARISAPRESGEGELRGRFGKQRERARAQRRRPDIAPVEREEM